MPSPPRHLLAYLTALLILPGCVLFWLASRVLEQDEAAARRAASDRLAAAAELAASRLLAKLNDIEDRLPSAAAGEHAAIIHLRRDGSATSRGLPLLYRPVEPEEDIADGAVFARADEAEFRRSDYSAAIGLLRPLLDSASRRGALVRLARNYRKAGLLDDALRTYEQLSAEGGDPLARQCICAIHASRRSPLLDACARKLAAGLASSAWPLDEASFRFHLSEAERWLGAAQPMTQGMAIAGAVNEVWEKWRAAENSRGRVAEHGLLVSWRCRREACEILAADAEWTRQLLDPGVTIGAVQGAAVIGPERSRLPWPISITELGEPAELTAFAARRRLIWTGAAGLGLLVFAAGYVIARAVARELAVARLQSDFVSAVSHEFRTPLTTLRHMTDVLERSAVSKERRAQYYGVLSRETERLQRLVESLLDFGRMEAGRAQYRFASLDATAFVAELVAEFRRETAARSNSISLNGEQTARHIHGDRDALGRALWNLLDNAVKYSAEGAPIRVETECASGRLAIRVSDQGIGIPDEERREIFRKFVRGKSARETGAKGTGIGLAMVDHIVRAHGGAVEVESEWRHGSTFTLWLPLENES